MGFSKAKYEPEVAVEVRHNWHPGQAFTFRFPKVLPQSALDAEASFLGLKQEADGDAVRKGIVNLVAEMITVEPEGFDDFPRDERALPERAREYFDDSSRPELEQIVSGAWAAYKQGARPAAYLKRLQDSRAGGGQPSGVPGETPPVV